MATLHYSRIECDSDEQAAELVKRIEDLIDGGDIDGDALQDILEDFGVSFAGQNQRDAIFGQIDELCEAYERSGISPLELSEEGVLYAIALTLVGMKPDASLRDRLLAVASLAVGVIEGIDRENA